MKGITIRIGRVRRGLSQTELGKRIGLTQTEISKLERAIQDFDEAIRLDSQLALAYSNRALAYKLPGKNSEAIADFEKFITLVDNPQWIEMARQQIEELSK